MQRVGIPKGWRGIDLYLQAFYGGEHCCGCLFICSRCPFPAFWALCLIRMWFRNFMIWGRFYAAYPFGQGPGLTVWPGGKPVSRACCLRLSRSSIVSSC